MGPNFPGSKIAARVEQKTYQRGFTVHRTVGKRTGVKPLPTSAEKTRYLPPLTASHSSYTEYTYMFITGSSSRHTRALLDTLTLSGCGL